MSPASYQTAPPRDAGDWRPTANDSSPILHMAFRYQRYRMQSGKRDSNPRPQPWQGCALPTELFPHLRMPILAFAPQGRNRIRRPASAPAWRRLTSGGEGDRTPDLVNAIHALSQLSYAPVILGGPENPSSAPSTGTYEGVIGVSSQVGHGLASGGHPGDTRRS